MGDPEVRKSICEDTTFSGLFSVIHMYAVPLKDVYRYRELEKYSKVFHRLFTFSASANSFVYSNRYELREFNVADTHRFEEHVFACPVVHLSDEDNIVLYYVSKEYNVNLLAFQPSKPGRFIFGRDFGNRKVVCDRVLLAEEPAVAFVGEAGFGFDIELHYLKIRKRTQLGKTCS